MKIRKIHYNVLIKHPNSKYDMNLLFIHYREYDKPNIYGYEIVLESKKRKQYEVIASFLSVNDDSFETAMKFYRDEVGRCFLNRKIIKLIKDNLSGDIMVNNEKD